MAAFEIVRATIRQAAAWSELRHQLWPKDSAAEHRREIEGMVSETDRLACFLAMDQAGIVVGFAEAALRFDYVNGCKTSPVAFLEGIFVQPDHRRSGVAKGLVAAVASWGRAAGAVEFASDADIANQESHAMHAALGFEETQRVVYFRKAL